MTVSELPSDKLIVVYKPLEPFKFFHKEALEQLHSHLSLEGLIKVWARVYRNNFFDPKGLRWISFPDSKEGKVFAKSWIHWSISEAGVYQKYSLNYLTEAYKVAIRSPGTTYECFALPGTSFH